jgi:hypothetical protein
MADPNSAELEDEFEEVVGAAAGIQQQYQYSSRCSISHRRMKGPQLEIDWHNEKAYGHTAASREAVDVMPCCC